MFYKQAVQRYYLRKIVEYDEKQRPHYSFMVIPHGKSFKFRFDPVPGVHKRRNRHRGYYRHPKTTSESRAWYVYKNSGAKLRRVRRNPKNLPSIYDDRLVSNYNYRGWKRTKKRSQWMRGESITVNKVIKHTYVDYQDS